MIVFFHYGISHDQLDNNRHIPVHNLCTHGETMRILNLDGHYFVEPFKKMGHEVLWLGNAKECDVRLERTISLATLLKLLDEHDFWPDITVWADKCSPPTVLGIESLPGITVGYSIDQYCNPWHPSFSAAFDLMLVAQKDYLDMFLGESGSSLEWAPLFCDINKDRNLDIERDIPVSFVGTVDGSINKERKRFLDDFKQAHPIIATQGDYVPIYNRSRIVLNQSAVGELNLRIFEAMACGAAVLTEETDNGLCELFTHGKDILLYPRGNPQAAAIVARSSLASPDLAELARRGQQKVLSHHSNAIRARHIVKKAKEIAASGYTWRKAHMREAQLKVANAYNILAIDDQLPLPSAMRDFFLEQASILFHEAKK